MIASYGFSDHPAASELPEQRGRDRGLQWRLNASHGWLCTVIRSTSWLAFDYARVMRYKYV